MKLLDEVKKIVESYDIEVHIPEQYKSVYDYRRAEEEKADKEFCDYELTDSLLIDKYKKHIPKGWYGFDIGKPTPENWFIIIDKVLELLTQNDPDLEIHQIKLKFGSIRFYVYSSVIEDMSEIEMYIEQTLFDRKLVY